MGHADLIAGLERVKNSFNSYPIDRLAMSGAIAAIDDQKHLETISSAVIKSREALIKDLNQLGFETIPSQANFIFTLHPKHDAGQLAQALRERHIIVRHFKQTRIDQYLRITIGTDEQCAALVKALQAILA
jgi:histidinol-phosphate aminotransferase